MYLKYENQLVPTAFFSLKYIITVVANHTHKKYLFFIFFILGGGGGTPDKIMSRNELWIKEVVKGEKHSTYTL